MPLERLGVEILLRGFQSLRNEGLHCFSAMGEEVLQLLLLRHGKLLEDEVGWILPTDRATDTHANAIVIGSGKGGCQALQTVVAIVAAGHFDSNRVEGDIELVVDDDDLCRFDLIKGGECLNWPPESFM